MSAQETVDLQLKWFHQFQFAGFYAAQKEGYYQDEGLKVNIREFSPGQEAIHSVISGKSEFAIADSSVVLTKLMGEPVVVLATIFQQSPLALMTLEEANLTSPIDLKGKRVMYRRNFDDAVITAMFSELGISDRDYQHVPHSFKDDELLLGNVDAMAVYITNQPFYYQERGIKVNLIQPANYGIDFYGDLIFTTKEYLLNNTQQALAFRKASLKGWQYAMDNPEAVVDWMLANLDIDKSKDMLMFEAQMTKRMIKPNLIDLGTLNKKRFQRIADIYQQASPEAAKGNLDDFLYTEVISPDVDYKRVAYVSWLGLALLIIIIMSFWGINKRLKVLVAERTKALEASKQALDKLVVTDELTGLGNRRALNKFFVQELDKATRYHRPLSLILFDIDHFKQINDQYGHNFGDTILKQISTLATQKTRVVDFIGRWGGEEFLMICPETDVNGALITAELLRETIASHRFSQNLSITCSFGVSQWREGESQETFFARCDSALYQAKHAGRNCVKTQ
ncbi:ABC transporter substrate-binding protein [Thalassotalea sp. LPB0316]|uniref:GGDEF domain-containing protein n=1 Tax=Thalassotalea sp. LPB0316 TaxID=2769490 RepID=UPI001867792E|nr:GGDEF domain-containing protein [Thalassotalea sp. LPB0316]QOL25389.1 ABC transporter substrate-binding protein [Thalassotalea sp. LPB0316]